MAQRAPLILRLVASSIRVAARAGKIIRDVMLRGELGIIDKGRNDLQTEADRSAQRCIVNSLSQQFPTVTIIAEEELSDYEVPSDWVVTDCENDILQLACPKELQDISDKEIVVWVDPLDGTSEYAQGFVEHVTVLIGVAVGDRPVAGVIHQPYYNYKSGGEDVGRTLWGIKGIGVGGFEPREAPKGKRYITTTSSHSNDMVQTALNALQPDKIMRVPGAGRKAMLLMEGKAHAYVFPSLGCNRWDTCASEAILVAMGGHLTDIHGNLYPYNKSTPYENSKGVVATGRNQDHEWYLYNLPDAVRQYLT